MWSCHIILVGGKLFTWKGCLVFEGHPLTRATSNIGSFSPKYFPDTDTKEVVEIHNIIFNDIIECNAYLVQLEPHKDKPDSFPILGDKHQKITPVKHAVFELEVATIESTGYKYWWVKGNNQSKPWDVQSS